MPLILFRSLFLILFILGCNSKTQLNSTAPSSCFNQFSSKEAFDYYIDFHQEHARANDNSRRLLGCAFYQKGDLFSAEKWLQEAYDQGQKQTAVDFWAIYLKEGQMNLVSYWKEETKKNKIPETTLSRWLIIIEELEKYNNSQNIWHLKNAQKNLLYKMKHEGSTPIIEQLIDTINKLISTEEDCKMNRPNCSLPYLSEQKSYMKVFSNGVLSTLIPSLPLHWQSEDYKQPSLAQQSEEDKKSES